jgi:hypothetical protein
VWPWGGDVVRVGDERERSASVRRSGIATAGPGGFANTGIINAQTINIGVPSAGRVARSVYLHQVRQIFPWELIGREAELAELEDFCTSSDGPSYLWWHGPAWAGKSALMAWFVLHPPDGVQVVSFFITDRYANHSNRTAFLNVVLEQLAEVAGQPMPDGLMDDTRQGWFVQLLQDAAAACERNELRLVLLVDGLDEDQGVTGRRDGHSIAALLPALLPGNTRVIVAGRPDPPVPFDVPRWHPLRDRRIVRRLDISPQAEMVRDDAERELSHLLDGGGLGRHLLGLVTAAGGGLSSDDLANLASESPGTVREILRGVSGRSFHGCDDSWRSSAARVFVLAHGTLQITAVQAFGEERLADYRDYLNRWADSYASRGWPAGTPVYLLREYFQVLVASGDTARVVGAAVDAARHDRMLSLSGGDAAAHAEIIAAQDLILAQPDPDLVTMGRLVLHRDDLAIRNAAIPISLPSVWVTLGQPDRADALARSLPDLDRQAAALTKVAKALASAGLDEQAARAAEAAETAARSITDPDRQADSLGEVAGALAGAGLAEQAAATARSITDPDRQGWALTKVAGALAGAGLAEQAAATARSITNPDQQAWALGEVAKALAGAGLAEQAAATARSITDPYWQAAALGEVAEALAGAGLYDRAEATALSITNLGRRAWAMAGVAETLAGAGLAEQAARAAEAAETAARSITDPEQQGWAMGEVAKALADAGLDEQAAATVRSITDPDQQAWALTEVAEGLARTRQFTRARRLIAQAWAVGHQIVPLKQ